MKIINVNFRVTIELYIRAKPKEVRKTKNEYSIIYKGLAIT